MSDEKRSPLEAAAKLFLLVSATENREYMRALFTFVVLNGLPEDQLAMEVRRLRRQNAEMDWM